MRHDHPAAREGRECVGEEVARLKEEERRLTEALEEAQDKLKHVKDDVREVTAGHECGMSFENYQDMREGDVIECFQVEHVQRTL